MYCKECRFWQRDGGDGICRAISPRPVTVESGQKYIVLWPRTNADDWCGVFQKYIGEKSEAVRDFA